MTIRTTHRTGTRLLPHVLLFCFSLLASYRSTAQYNYEAAKILLASEGYTICEDKVAYLAQGSVASFYHTFSPDYSYRIIAVSNDVDVKDVDIYLYNSDYEYDKDDDNSRVAVLDVQTVISRYMRVKFKNYHSATPTYRSAVYVLVGYK